MNFDLYYLDHSAFYLETDKVCLLFDYGSMPVRPKSGCLQDRVFDFDRVFQDHKTQDKPLLALFSHRHSDHYQTDLIKQLLDAGASCVLADELSFAAEDFMEHPNFYRLFPRTRAKICLDGQGESLIFDLAVSGSTDQGGSFLLRWQEGSLYFAGDLAVWDDESVFYEGFAAERDWLRQVQCESAGEDLDMAFLPCSTSDGWQETPLLEGNISLIKLFTPKLVIPMHAYDYEQFYQSFADYILQSDQLDQAFKLDYFERFDPLTPRHTINPGEPRLLVVSEVSNNFFRGSTWQS